MRILMLLAILMVSFSVFAVESVAGSQYEVEQDTVKEQITISVNAVFQERTHNVTGENTQPISCDRNRCYKPVYRVGVSAPIEVGWRF